MKKILFSVLVILISSNLVFSQSSNNFPIPTGSAYVLGGANSYYKAGAYLTMGNSNFGGFPYLGFNSLLTTSSSTNNLFSPYYTSGGAGLVIRGDAAGSGLHFMQGNYGSSQNPIDFTTFYEALTLNPNGNFGINNNNPNYKLQVSNGAIAIDNGVTNSLPNCFRAGQYLTIGHTSTGNSPYFSFNAVLNSNSANTFTPTYAAGSGLVILGEAGASGLHFRKINYGGSSSAVDITSSSVTEVFTINSGGQIGINTPTGYNFGTLALAVEGKIGAREVIVSANTPIADYVFDKDYKLKSLDSLETYIEKNKHLPNIPSAQDVKDANNTINLGDMNNKLLEKIEELTLYVIQLKKENEEIKKAIEEKKN